MYEQFVPVLLVLGVAVAFSGVFLGISFWLGPRRPNAMKESIYECGVPVRGSTQIRFFVRFFMIALLFLLFDLEAVFLYPWVLIFSKLNAAGYGMFALVEMIIFVLILVVGFVYEWKKGGLEWQ
jgi:NADH-quinone oxidoreductase subunit A